MTDEELKALVAGLAIAQQKTDEQIVSLFAAQKEVSEQIKRTDEQMKRTDEQMKRTDEQMKRTDEKLERIGITLANISHNQGDVAEEFFYNSLEYDPHLGSIRFDDISKNEYKRRGKTAEEYDIIMTNGETIGIIEVKYKAHQNDLQKLERKMHNFKKLFPWFKDYKLYGAIASFHFHEDAKSEALQRGFFVLQRRGDLVHSEHGQHLMIL